MRTQFILSVLALLVLFAGQAMAAYHHEGEIDSPNFLAQYVDAAGTKLDHCATCHSGGEYEKKPGKFVALGSCQWCHYVTEYGSVADAYGQTLNEYGADYMINGRSQAALAAIESQDSDGDGFSNADEIQALTFPGDASDDPSKTAAPSRSFTLEEIEAMSAHTQVQVMNTHKSGDYYASFTGVPLPELLEKAGILDTAESITVFAPDGWSQTFPLEGDGEPNNLYPVYKDYPASPFYYDVEADSALTDYGWCDYSSPAIAGLANGDMLPNPEGLKLILAYKLDGAYLTPGELDADNRLNGDGPYRLVPPQLAPGPPDQAVTAENQDVIWPFTEDWDHNAGFSPRSVTIIRVDPLPEGTTDVDILEAGWNYIDQARVLVYGSIDPDDGDDSGCVLQPNAGFSGEIAALVVTALCIMLAGMLRGRRTRI